MPEHETILAAINVLNQLKSMTKKIKTLVNQWVMWHDDGGYPALVIAVRDDGYAMTAAFDFEGERNLIFHFEKISNLNPDDERLNGPLYHKGSTIIDNYKQTAVNIDASLGDRDFDAHFDEDVLKLKEAIVLADKWVCGKTVMFDTAAENQGQYYTNDDLRKRLGKVDPNPVKIRMRGAGASLSFEVIGYPFDKDTFSELKKDQHVKYNSLASGQLWEECYCGQEPVCVNCHKCSKHCKCGASYWTITLDGIIDVLESGRIIQTDDGYELYGSERKELLRSIEEINEKRQESVEKARKKKEDDLKTLKQEEEDFFALVEVKLKGLVQLPEDFKDWEASKGESYKFGKKFILEEVSVKGTKAWRYYSDAGLGDDIRANIWVLPKIATDYFKSEINENNRSLIYEGIIKFFPEYAKKHDLKSFIACYGYEAIRYAFDNDLIDANMVESFAKTATENWFKDDHDFSWGSTKYIQIPEAVKFTNEREGRSHEDLMKKIEARVNEITAIKNAKFEVEQKKRDEEKQAKISKITAEKEKEIKSLSKEELVYKYDYLKKSWSKEKMLESMIEHELNPDKFKKKSRYDDDEEYGPDYY